MELSGIGTSYHISASNLVTCTDINVGVSGVCISLLVNNPGITKL